MTNCRVLHVTILTSLRMVKVTFGKTSRWSDIYPKKQNINTGLWCASDVLDKRTRVHGSWVQYRGISCVRRDDNGHN